MDKLQSLAEYLGTAPAPGDERGEPSIQDLEDIANAEEFARGVLNSREFRQYLTVGLTLGSIPAAIILRLMDYACGKPVDRHELTGKDGGPLETTITKVRRVIVRSQLEDDEEVPSESVH